MQALGEFPYVLTRPSPFAGMSQIRFGGYDLSLSPYEKDTPVEQGMDRRLHQESQGRAILGQASAARNAG